jgi:Flp pilus assembly protein TadD
MNALELQDALEALIEAIDADPNKAEYHFRAGNIQRQLGNLKAASMAYAKAIELEDGYVLPYINLGIVYHEMGEQNKALNIFRRGIVLAEKDPLLRFNYAAALDAGGNPEEAAGAYRAALDLKPDWPEALNNLGVLLFKTGQPDKALELFQKAPSLSGPMEELWNRNRELVAGGGTEDVLSPQASSPPGSARMIPALEAAAESPGLKALREPGDGTVPKSDLIALMYYLRDLSGELTGKDGKDFIRSDARLGLEYIINALEGRKGLFREIQDQLPPGEAPAAEPEGEKPKPRDVADTLKYLKELAVSLPDPNLGAAIGRRANRVITKIRQSAESEGSGGLHG